MGKIVLFLTLLSIFSGAVPIRTSDWFMGNAGAVPEYKAPQFSEYRILAVNNLLLGGYCDGRWIEWPELYPMMAETNDYKMYIDGHYQGTDQGRRRWNTVRNYIPARRCIFQISSIRAMSITVSWHFQEKKIWRF